MSKGLAKQTQKSNLTYTKEGTGTQVSLQQPHLSAKYFEFRQGHSDIAYGLVLRTQVAV
ncbi:hypothetical protein AGMMS50222_04590 [Endomicrobiia bacterium]|nr:hypothetical protein AGMMS50222_04590 [Endomicrobiia bacterium]